MSVRIHPLALASLMLAAGLVIAGCKGKPFDGRYQEAVGLAQVPAPVKATSEQQAQGRSVGELERQTAKARLAMPPRWVLATRSRSYSSTKVER